MGDDARIAAATPMKNLFIAAISFGSVGTLESSQFSHGAPEEAIVVANRPLHSNCLSRRNMSEMGMNGDISTIIAASIAPAYTSPHG